MHVQACRGTTTIRPRFSQGPRPVPLVRVNRCAITGASRNRLLLFFRQRCRTWKKGSPSGSGVSFELTSGGALSLDTALCSPVGFSINPHHCRLRLILLLLYHEIWTEVKRFKLVATPVLYGQRCRRPATCHRATTRRQ